MKPYGYELILDMHGCDPSTFNRKSLRQYFKKLCQAIDMTRCKLVFWDDIGVPPKEQQKEAHTKGTSAVQFILTSNVTVHTLDALKAVYVNIFSCKGFDREAAAQITKDWFVAKSCSELLIRRV